jgi:AcrR family transcriptional regulator
LVARRRAPTLRSEDLARGGLKIIDREGLEGLSMRRLASEAGIGTMTLYGYFRDKDALLDAIVDVAASERRIPATRGPWKDQLRDLMRGLRAALEKHPGLIRIRLQRPMISPGVLRGEEIGIRAMLKAGFTKAEAARAWRTLFIYTTGFVAFSPPQRLEESRRQARAAAAALPPEDYPSITSMIQELADTMGGDEQFEFGLDALLEGYDRLLRARRKQDLGDRTP